MTNPEITAENILAGSSSPEYERAVADIIQRVGAETTDETTLPPHAEAVLKALYDALRAKQHGQLEPTILGVGMLNEEMSAIYIATERHWKEWVRS